MLVARPLTEVDRRSTRCAYALAAARAGRDRARGRCCRGSRCAPPSRPVAELTDTAEHVGRHARSHAPDRRRTATTRSRAWPTAFNTMLEALERSQTRAAAARRRRVARAAHAAHLAAHEPRGARARRAAGRGRPRAPARGPRRCQLEELTGARRRPHRARPRRGAPRSRTCASTRSSRARWSARAGTRRGITFAVELEPTLVSGVPGRLDRAVGNLLDNAAKYSPAGSVVDVRLRDGELTVRDHGPGIPAADRAHVFDRFYRADAARGRPGLGARPGDRAPGGRDARRHGGRGGRRRRRRAAAAARCRSSQQLPRFG